MWLLTLFALCVLTGSYLSVLYRAINIDGDPMLFVLVVSVACVGGILTGRYWSILGAALGAVVLGLFGMMMYVPTLPDGYSVIISFDFLMSDLIALLTGLSILRIINAGMWATAVAPLPIFLTGYFVVRRQYVMGTAVGSAALLFFVLTGDAESTIVLVGVIAAVTAVGCGDLARSGGTIGNADILAVVLALCVVLSLTISVVPGGSSEPILPGGESGSSAETIQGSLMSSDSELSIQGSIRLSPEVRFTVESNQPAYWRVGAYNRYTGSGWIRTVGNTDDDALSSPPGPSTDVRQNITIKTASNVMPAAWKPTTVYGVDPQVTAVGGLRPGSMLSSGDTYSVVSQVSTASPAQLNSANGPDPDHITGQYTKLPSDTPERIETYTNDVITNASADSRYEKARVIEQHLQQEKNYSLNVERPDSHVADTFLFERDAGYCTYFATTMATMLRSQGIPARFVVGYTSGQQVDSNERVVRGLDSHAWVEVYFPEYGWVQFDPTPSDPREQAEQGVLDSARSENRSDVDTNRSEPTPTPTPTTDTDNTTQPTPTESTPNGSTGSPQGPDQRGMTPPGMAYSGGTGGAGGNEESLPIPSPTEVAFGTIVLLGVLALLYRSSGAIARVVWLLGLPFSRSGDPEQDIRGAYERQEYLISRSERPRRPDETRMEYLQAVGNEEAKRLGEIYERAVYAGEPTESLATEAIEILRGELRDRLRV